MLSPVTARAMTVAIGVAQHLPHDLLLELDPLSPAGQAGFQLALRVDGDLIVDADVRIGLMHRSAEKLFEVRDYRQVLALANRHEWLSAFMSEVCIALTVEQAMGITPPERATWSRTLLAELNRVTASLALLAPLAPCAPAIRERLVTLQEVLTGGRVHPMFVRIGGIAAPLTGEWLDALTSSIAELRAETPLLASEVTASIAPLAGIGVLSRDDAIACAATGPVGRASGVDLDLRRDAPYLAYGELTGQLQVTTATTGDAAARYTLLLEQIAVSAQLIDSCISRLRELGEGPVDVSLPKVVRAPEGTTYGQVESTLGIAGALLVSNAEKAPWRLKLRTASIANLQALQCALPGTSLDQLAAVVPSFMFVIGDSDR